MNLKHLMFVPIALAGLLASTDTFAAEASAPPPEASILLNSTRTELLMFFDEKDLVTATKRSTSLRKAPAIATIVTAEEIRNMGARNLLDVLKMVPGFGVSINEFGTYMIEVRGIRTSLSEKVLFMIDGHAANKNINGSAWIYNVASYLPLENIKQVEIVRGPGSALYGSNAFVAIVNVITREASEINGLEIKASGGINDTYKGNITTGKAFGDKLSVSGHFDHTQSDGAKLTVGADALTGTPFSQAPGKTHERFKQSDAFLKMEHGDISFRTHYSKKQHPAYVGYAYALSTDSDSNHDYFWAELAYDVKISDEFSTKIKLNYDYYRQHANAKLYPNGFFGSFPDGMIGNPKVKDRSIGGEIQFDWDIFKGNHLISGFSYEQMSQYDVKQLANFDPTATIPTYLGSIQEVANWNKNATRKVWAVYVQDEWQIHDKVNLTVGARYDNYNEFGGSFSPRAGIVWNFLEKADLKVLYGSAFRAPNFVELYNINNPIIVGNSKLKPEKIKTFEVGITYRLAKWLAADVNYFHSRIMNLIAWDSSTAPALYANIGQAKVQGIETAFHGAINALMNWKLQYAYQDPRDSVTGRKLPYVPEHRAMASINFAPSRYLNLHSDVLWTGKRPRDVSDTRPDMPSYTTLDLAATVKNVVKNMEWQAAIHNLLNNKFKDPDTSGALIRVPGDFPREGISALLSVTYKF